MPPYLNQTEVIALERFNADPMAKEAVKKVILARIYHDGVLREGIPSAPLKNFMLNIVDQIGNDLTDAELGALTRTRRIAAELLESGLKDIEKFKHIEQTLEKPANHR